MAGCPVNPAKPVAGPRSGEMRSLVLRAWLEPGPPPHLRTRIVEIALGRSDRPVLATTSIEEACAAVRNWLETLQSAPADENGGGAQLRGI
jgi:hypothetical protein